MTSRFIYLTVALFLMTFCKKNKEDQRIVVNGTVINELTKRPIGGLTISLNESCGSSSLGSGSGWTTIKSVVTNIEGNYFFDQEVRDCNSWKVDINASPNYDSKFSTTWFQVRPNEKIQITTEIYRNTSLKVRAITNSPLGPNDDFTMMLPGLGCRCFELTTDRAKGGFKNLVSWNVIRNGITTNHSDSVLCPVDSLKSYLITY